MYTVFLAGLPAVFSTTNITRLTNFTDYTYEVTITGGNLIYDTI